MWSPHLTPRNPEPTHPFESMGSKRPGSVATASGSQTKVCTQSKFAQWVCISVQHTGTHQSLGGTGRREVRQHLEHKSIKGETTPDALRQIFGIVSSQKFQTRSSKFRYVALSSGMGARRTRHRDLKQSRNQSPNTV